MLDFDFIEWDDTEDDGFNNVEHIEAAGLTPEEVEEVLYSPSSQPDRSDSSGRAAVFGWTDGGKRIIVVYELTEDAGVRVLYPITAYEVPARD